MRGYDRDDMDEYEDDGFIEHDEEQGEYEEDGEEEEEEEKEVRKPTKEELDYLEIRQRIKERMRKKMKKENGAVTGISHVKKKLPYDNYGHFFGPSQPVIAQRVIQESKSLLENQHLAARVSNSPHNLQSKTSTSSTTATSRPGVRNGPPKVVNVVKQKVQTLRDSRDYSFLLSDDAELPAPSRVLPPQKISVPNSAHAPSKSPKSGSSSSRPVPNGREQRTHVSMGHQMQSKAGQHKVAPGSRPNSTLANPRKQLGSSAANGPGRPLGTKGLLTKMPVPTKTSTSNKMSILNKIPASTMDKKASVVGVERPLPGVQKAPLPRSQSSVTGVQRTPLPKSHLSRPGVQKAPLSKLHLSEQRREFREPDRGRLMSKQPVPSSRPQIQPPKQNPSRAPMQNDRPKKRPTRPFADEDEDDNAISMIRNMFRYNPNKYAKIDEDDSDMEAGFDDILKEEKYSSKVAREEDERELRLIEEEERRERMRKEAKRRKLSQR